MSQDDRDTVTAGLRIGDQERDQAVAELREQYALGRLDHDEFDQRLEAAVAARTAPELRHLLADLPAPSKAVDWRPGPARHATTRPDGRPDREAQRRAHRHLRGRHHGPPHRGPGVLPLVPIAAIMLFVGGWAVMALLPLLCGGLVFTAARRGRCL